jgi:hypothetical protein
MEVREPFSRCDIRLVNYEAQKSILDMLQFMEIREGSATE